MNLLSIWGALQLLWRVVFFFKTTGLPKISPDEDPVMICGSMAMLKDCARMCEGFGLVEGANNAPASSCCRARFCRVREQL